MSKSSLPKRRNKTAPALAVNSISHPMLLALLTTCYLILQQIRRTSTADNLLILSIPSPSIPSLVSSSHSSSAPCRPPIGQPRAGRNPLPVGFSSPFLRIASHWRIALKLETLLSRDLGGKLSDSQGKSIQITVVHPISLSCT